MSGYSGTPLAVKLGVKPESSVRLVGAPDGFEALLDPLPAGVTVRRAGPLRADVVVFCTTSYADLARRIEALGQAVFPDRALWVAWPKKASRVPTDLDENVVRDHGLEVGLVDVKVAAIDPVWGGLKFVVRLRDR